MYTGLKGLFKNIADAIREKTGSNALIKAADFPSAIEDIVTIPAGWHDTGAVNATAADVLSPKKIVDANGNVLTGAIQSQAAGVFSASTVEQTILQPGKYISGEQKLSAILFDNLAPENIKSGVTVKVRSGGNTLATVTGKIEGQAKVLNSAPIIPQAGSDDWKWTSNTGVTYNLAHLSIAINTIGFIPDAIIAVRENNVIYHIVWTRKKYSGGGSLDYWDLSWEQYLVRFKNDILPESLDDIWIPIADSSGNYNVICVKE